MRGPFLYIFSEGPAGPCKVGWAKNPENRFKTLQTGNPRPMTFEWYLGECPDAHAIEQLTHVELADRRLTGEWFAVTPSEAEAAIAAVIERGLPPKRVTAPGDGHCRSCGGSGWTRYASPAERQRAYRERKKKRG